MQFIPISPGATPSRPASASAYAGGMADDPGLVVEELGVDECLELLRHHRVGRLAVATPDGPAIFPVNYALGGDRVVFRTDLGTKLEGSALRRVAFEIDEYDDEARTGWSVVVEGVGTEISDAIDPESVALQALELHPFAPGPKSHLVEIHPRVISGRRIVAR
jgi:nitroimidazol reductase NimA-like FMN-containing flavoprotein (pyridoxamine 5'-phosphate oxidase superfamily)